MKKHKLRDSETYIKKYMEMNELTRLTQIFHKLEGGDIKVTPKLNENEIYLKQEIVNHINRKTIECNKYSTFM
jgi:hypothetical protein